MHCPACSNEIGFPWRLPGLRNRTRCRECGAELKLSSVADGIIRGLPVVLAMGLAAVVANASPGHAWRHPCRLLRADS